MSYPNHATGSGGNAEREARTSAREAMREVEELRKDVDRLLLINEALWRIVRERLECTDEDLVRRIQDIDLEDGRKAASSTTYLCLGISPLLAFGRQGGNVTHPPGSRPHHATPDQAVRKHRRYAADPPRVRERASAA